VKAVVLVGGEGTRMRPLTTTTPKPLLPLVDRPILDHVLDHVARHGVHEVVLSSPYLEATFAPFIGGRRGDPAITWITETTPLGTGGAIVHALDALGDEPFVALNGDILTDLDLTAMRRAHTERRAAVSIALHRVSDARAFGLVETDASGRVRAFREKPADEVPGDINAGTYLIDPTVLGGWTADGAISIEREIFPALIEGGHEVHGFTSSAYWIDLGTPAQYLRAHADLLAGRVGGSSYPAPWVHPSASVSDEAALSADVAVGPEAVVAPGASLRGSVVLGGARIGRGARIAASVVGPGAEVGEGASLDGCVIGPDADVAAGSVLSEARVVAADRV
jgi:mannose-1-phosphate guanylyltransferase